MVDERRKEILHNKWNLKIYLIYFFRGFRGIVFSRKKRIGAVLFIVSLVNLDVLLEKLSCDCYNNDTTCV